MRDGASHLQNDSVRPDPGGRFALVMTRFNQDIVDRLIHGCMEGFAANGIAADRVDLYWTPGAFELPTICGRWRVREGIGPSSVSAPSSARDRSF